jgi:cation diffusion facilitator family transporter
MSADSTKHVVQSLVANLVIAAAKGVAAVLTKSGAMLAEAIHSGADCANQLLLLMGIKRAAKPPDEGHPLGYGRALYFWSFIVALLLFSGGGVFSIYEGWHKLSNPEMPDNVSVGVGVLGFAILLEGGATISNIRELNKRRGKTAFFQYLRSSKDSDLIVVFGENSAATLGLVLALGAIVATVVTKNPLWDAIGTLAIGAVLVAVAIFLGVEISSLLEGEAADPEVVQAAKQAAAEREHMRELLDVIAVQQGPGEVLMALKVKFTPELTARQVCDEINAFETALRKERPDVKWLFVEPDRRETAEASKASRVAKSASKPSAEVDG